jgi:hypothetical protein
MGIAMVMITLFSMMKMLQGAEDEIISITYITSAVAKGAVCLDGSAPAYQFDRAAAAAGGEGHKNWLIHLKGGGWCDTIESCTRRRNTPLGSSTLMKPENFTAILSNNKDFNPNFYNWNRIMVRYCDGSSYTGDEEKVDPVTQLHFRGARVFNAVIEDLLTKGLKNASNVLLSGCSAGGLASVLHCDKFRTLLPPSVNVKCVADGGYFLHKKHGYGGYELARMFRRAIKLHGSAKNLPKSCTSKMKSSLCFFPQYITPHIHTPLFIINSAFDPYQVRDLVASRQSTSPGGSWFECQFDVNKCSTNQLGLLLDFKTMFYEEISKGLRSNSKSLRGMFINTCHTHCQSQLQEKWLGSRTAKIDNKSISEAVGDWFYERRSGRYNKHMDHKHGLPHWCLFDPLEPNPNNNYTWPPS